MFLAILLFTYLQLLLKDPCEQFSEINEIEMNGSDPDGCNFFPSKSLTANALESVLLTSGMPKMSLFAFFRRPS